MWNEGSILGFISGEFSRRPGTRTASPLPAACGSKHDREILPIPIDGSVDQIVVALRTVAANGRVDVVFPRRNSNKFETTVPADRHSLAVPGRFIFFVPPEHAETRPSGKPQMSRVKGSMEWRNWQTHGTQNPASFTGYEGSTPSSSTIESIGYG